MRGGLGAGGVGREDKDVSKVFVITKGSYSDYTIVGIYSTSKGAQRAISLLNIEDVNEIEEYELNELDPLVNKFARGYRIWWVSMQRDGTVARVYAERSLHTYINHRKDGNPAVWGQVLAKSEEHAIKIVNDKRAQLIAAGEL